MPKTFIAWVVLVLNLFAPTQLLWGADRPLLMVHYMPWFAAKTSTSPWGWHWTMGKCDPDRHPGGKSEIASHFYPLIGPYDSGDRDVLEYQTLLMKVAGIDGVIADWYGTEDVNDYAFINRSTGALFEAAARAGLKVAVCFEDRTLGPPKNIAATKFDAVERGRAVIAVLLKTWMANAGYLQINGRPALFVFGPIGLTGDQWRDILKGQSPLLLTLHHSAGPAEGVFDWPLPKDGGVERSKAFPANVAKGLVAVPVVYPRFGDYYSDAGVGDSYGMIDDDNGRTFELLMASAMAINPPPPVIQIATWNDWGEGTQIEPSREFGYRDLEVIQKARMVTDPTFLFNSTALSLPAEIFRLRKLSHGDTARMKALDGVVTMLLNSQATEAAEKLRTIQPAGH